MAQSLAERGWSRLAADAGVELRLMSAGVGAVDGQTASPHARAVVAAHGGDLSEHRSTPVSALPTQELQLFLTMTRSHRDRLRAMLPGREDDIFTLGEFAGDGIDVADPFGGSREDYAENYEQLGGLIDAASAALRERIARAHEESTAAKSGGHHPEKGPSRA